MAVETFRDIFDQPAIRDLFAQADQDRVHADLAAFCGPNAEVYLPIYRKMREGSDQWVASWSWAGFFVPTLWLFYRKLYVLGTLCLLLPAFVAFGPDAAAGSVVGGSMGILIAVWSKAWYVSTGLRRIAEADRLELAGSERRDFLRRVGGVSASACWLIAFLHAALIVVAIGWGFANMPSATFQSDADLMRHGFRLPAPR